MHVKVPSSVHCDVLQRQKIRLTHVNRQRMTGILRRSRHPSPLLAQVWRQVQPGRCPTTVLKSMKTRLEDVAQVCVQTDARSRQQQAAPPGSWHPGQERGLPAGSWLPVRRGLHRARPAPSLIPPIRCHPPWRKVGKGWREARSVTSKVLPHQESRQENACK